MTAYEASQEEMREHIVQLRERVNELRDRLDATLSRQEETERRLAHFEMPRSASRPSQHCEKCGGPCQVTAPSVLR